MIKQAVHLQSGRIVAAGRVLLATFFLLTLWLDPVQSARGLIAAYIVLAWYAFLSVTHLIATWNNWWLERRLGGPAHALDLMIFAFLVFLAEALLNPYFAFSVFLVLSATMRWGWREAMLTAILASLLFLIAAVAAARGSPHSGLESFIIPGAHLVILSVIIIWFGLNQQLSSYQIIRLSGLDLDMEHDHPPVRRVLEFVGTQFTNARIILAWWDMEEPWTHVATFVENKLDRFQFSPQEMPFLIGPDIAATPVLFDLSRKHLLLARQGRKILVSKELPVNRTFAKKFDIERGLRIPIRADSFGGEVFILNSSVLSADDLDLGERIGMAISATFARAALFLATEEAAATRERLSFARDLHDSVVQFLAGISMQIEGVRKSIKAKANVGPQIDALQRDLQLEQRDLRRFIVALRGGRGPAQLSDLSQFLSHLTTRLARQWGIECRLKAVTPSIEASAQLLQDVDLLIREALANAVRHGGARTLSISAKMENDGLELIIEDDGAGFPFKGALSDSELKKRKLGPWSLHERIQKSGGNLDIDSSDKGARLTITLPARETVS